MSFAIRFLPNDPADPSPALYLSTDAPRDLSCKLTSVAADVCAYHEGMRWKASHDASRNAFITNRCRRDRLRADVVTLNEALRDLAT